MHAGAFAPEHAAAKRGHHRLFLLVREKAKGGGGSSAPSEPPLATCLFPGSVLDYGKYRYGEQNILG